MSDFYSNPFPDIDFSLEEIEKMRAEEIAVYNENPIHKLKIRDKTELIVFGLVPIIFQNSVCRITQKSQRKYIRISHFIIYAILFALVTIIAAVA